jgi:PAS domain S-box-containing protein
MATAGLDFDDVGLLETPADDPFFEMSHDLLAECDPRGRALRLNPAWERILGHRREALLSRPLTDVVHPDDADAMTDAYARLAQGAPVVDHEVRFRRADGSWRTVSWSWTCSALNGRGFGIGRDVTEQRAAEIALRQSEERLRIAQEAGGVGTFEWFPDTGEVFVSEQYCRLWGIDPRPMVTTDELLRYLHPDDYPLTGPAKIASPDTALHYAEYRAMRPDTGEIRWLARRGEMLRTADGSAPRMVGVLYDVTERRLAEQRLTRVLESVTDGFYGIDSQWRFTLFNRAAEQFFGMRREDVLGRSIWELFPEALGSELENNFRRTMGERIAVTFDAPSHARPDRIVEMRIAPKEDGGLAAAFSDVTDRKDAERHRELLLHELDHRVKNMLAIVQAMARQSFREGSISDARRAFEERLTALAEAHAILTRRSWEAVDLGDLLASALAPFGNADEQRVTADGVALRLPARTAIAFALAVHELATNAAKYGALSNETGRIAVEWRIDEIDGNSRIRFSWRERGGPPVAPPMTRGFGSRMIERGLAAELRGSVRLDFAPDGLVCEIDAPLQPGSD